MRFLQLLKIKTASIALTPIMAAGLACGNGPLDVSVAVESENPVQFDDTQLKLILKNTGEEPLRLVDRFSGRALAESFIISIKDEDGKFIASNNNFRRFYYPRTLKYKTLKKNAQITIPVTLSEILYEPRLPLRHLMPEISDDKTYYITLTYAECDQTGETRQMHQSEPVAVKFEKRDTPEYKVFNSVELSSPRDMSVPVPADDPSDGLVIKLQAEDVITSQSDSIEVTFENNWDKPIVLWKLLPDEGERPNQCTLSFIVSRKDGTPVVPAKSAVKMEYNPKYNSKINAGDSLTIQVPLAQFLPANLFNRDGEYYLIVRYDNKDGEGNLRGVWYSQPTKINIAGS